MTSNLTRYITLFVSVNLSFLVTTGSAESPNATTINLAQPPAEFDVSPMKLKVVEAFPKLRIERPIFITHAGDGSSRLVIGSQTGQIYWVDNDPAVAEPKMLMDLSPRVTYKDNENEEGMLGIAFHPKFKENHQFYVYYTSNIKPNLSVVSRFRMKADSPLAGDIESEERLLEIQQPAWNHNGGTVLFGPDGYLYVGLGDGGKANDPWQTAQDRSNFLGSILRIDVDRKSDGKPYAIPKDNPFKDDPKARPEIYAKGVRNIWRMAFDQKTGDLWAGDVGQDLWEEINVIRRGGNYGWSLREAAHRFEKHPDKGSEARADLIDPIAEYPHTDDWGKSITGGAVWRSSRLPELDGCYLYGDYVTGRLWALHYDRRSGKAIANRPIPWQRLPVFTFGSTADGEVLFSTMMAGGRIFKFERSE